MSWEVIEGDSLTALTEVEANSIDAIVTDPPYGLEFMGKEWDAFRPDTCPPGITEGVRADTPRFSRTPTEAMKRMQEWHQAWATEALRVLKPGGHLLAFGGTRTYHRLTTGVEDAGFEIRDSIIWLYGSGFPKSLNVSKAIDQAAGAQREVTDTITDRWQGRGEVYNRAAQDNGGTVEITEAATPEAREWEGWGTALKPSHEPIVIARKPIESTVANNVMTHRTGALNIDATRIEVSDADRGNVEGREWVSPEQRVAYSGFDSDGTRKPIAYHEGGRWPANAAVSPEVADEIDRQSGERRGNFATRGESQDEHIFGFGNDRGEEPRGFGDQGGAGRFFYTAKASRTERNAGLDSFPFSAGPSSNYGTKRQHPLKAPGEPNLVLPVQNPHPTVKPIDLMRWLVRMVTAPQGTVLDPFTGSGTTGIAAVLEGMSFIGIEREPDYVPIARARIAWWEPHAGRPTAEALGLGLASEADRRTHTEAGQIALDLP